MDEENKELNGEKSPIQKLNTIDETLASCYPAPKEFAFSSNEDERIVQKAVLYHRLRKDPDLSAGKKSPEADKKYEQMAADILEGRDPVVQYIQGKDVKEKANLLRELTESDRKSARFEELLTISAQKKAEADAVDARQPAEMKPEENQPAEKGIEGNKPREQKAEEKKPLTRQELKQRLQADGARLQGAILQKIVDNRDQRPAEFFAESGNLAAMRRLAAIKVHETKIDQEEREYRESLRYEAPADRERMMQQRPLLPYEQQAMQDYEGHLKKLENSPEVISVLHQMQQVSTVQGLGNATVETPVTRQLRTHDNISRLENKLVPDAIKAYFSGPDAPEDDSRLRKKLNQLSAIQKENSFPEKAAPEDCRKRIEEYKSILELMEKEGKLDTPGGKELQEVLSSQIQRLDDTMVARDRDNVRLNFRADTLIDYYDPNDPEHRPMDAVEARERLIRGAALEQQTFAGDDFCGTMNTVSYDKKTGKIIKGPEKLITRAVDLSQKTEGQPTMQLEELRKIKEVLSKSDPFYVKNSESYKNTMQSLNKVIKAQESLNKQANVRQVAELRALYGELDANAAQYIKEKGDRMKPGNERGQIRMDAMQTLRSITGKDHVQQVACSLYAEENKLDKQRKMLQPCKAVMDKWKKAGTPTTPEGIAEFKKDFDALSDRIGQLKQSSADMTYFKMGISDSLDKFTKQAEEVQEQIQDPKARLDANQLENMQSFRNACEASMKDFYAMDSTIHTEKKKEEKTETIQPPEKKKNGPVK